MYRNSLSDDQFDHFDSEVLVDQTVGKQPLRKLLFALTRISKVVALHLSILKNQKTNIEKLKISDHSEKLQSELINASRTVQQLKADIHELDIVRQQVANEDLNQFNLDARKLQNEILIEIASFIEIHSDTMAPCSSLQHQALEQPKRSSFSSPCTTEPNQENIVFGIEGDIEEIRDSDKVMLLETMQKENQKVNTTLKSWAHLNEEFYELRSLIGKFARMIIQQREEIDRIESNVQNTRENVHEGVKNTSKAAKFKLVMVPVTGAAIGGLLGGPIGLLSGAKMAAVVACVGSAIGFTVAHTIKKHLRKRVESDVELKDLQNKENVPSTNEDESGKLKTS